MQKNIYIKETKRAFLNPSKVEKLLVLFWDNGKIVQENMDSIEAVKKRVNGQIKVLRSDFKRMLNPTPYKVYYLNHYLHIDPSFDQLVKSYLFNTNLNVSLDV